jgi:formate dehydrogenase major subunit
MTDKTGPIKFTLDGREVEAPPGETIFNTARRYGIELPNLCYSPAPGYRPDGNCRVCMVEIEGERVLAASCIRTPTPGMKVKTETETDRAADGGGTAARRPARPRCRP